MKGADFLIEGASSLALRLSVSEIALTVVAFGTSTPVLINPIHFPPVFNIDLFILTGASALLFVTMFTGKKRFLDKWEAVLFILLYGAYIAYLLIRR